MGKIAQLIMGPAGVGKSSYCRLMQDHCKDARRRVYVVNLDPAAENFNYDADIDIRELITVDDVMEEMELGPNGALVYCMEFLLDNFEWLEEKLDETFREDDYLIIDCPGQIELYSHIPVMNRFTNKMKGLGYMICGVYLIDANFMLDPSKFISGTLLCLSTMVALEFPQVNVITKCDLVDRDMIERLLDNESSVQLLNMASYEMQRDLIKENDSDEEEEDDDFEDEEEEGLEDSDHDKGQTIESRKSKRRTANSSNSGEALLYRDKREAEEIASSKIRDAGNSIVGNDRLEALTRSIAGVVDDFTMVSFSPLDPHDENTVEKILYMIDMATQYGEDLEPTEPIDV